MNHSMRELRENGRCTTDGSHELFFSEEPADLAKAQCICAQCHVRAKCLDVALQENLEWGVWGGVIFWDGQPYHRKRGRGRPRHVDSDLPVEATRRDLLDLVGSA